MDLSSGQKIGIGAGIVVVLALIALGIYFAVKSSNSNSDSTPPPPATTAAITATVTPQIVNPITAPIIAPIIAPVVITTPAPSPVPTTAMECGGAPLNMTCAAGKISSGTINYGRWDTTSCPLWGSATPAFTQYKVPASCIGQASCSLTDLNSSLGQDPYPNVVKNAQANFTCQA